MSVRQVSQLYLVPFWQVKTEHVTQVSFQVNICLPVIMFLLYTENPLHWKCYTRTKFSRLNGFTIQYNISYCQSRTPLKNSIIINNLLQWLLLILNDIQMTKYRIKKINTKAKLKPQIYAYIQHVKMLFNYH